MKTIWCWQSTLKTAIESNSTEHWAQKAKRHKKQKNAIKKIFMVERPKINLPCKITLTRIAPRELDAHDGLAMSFKWVSDAIAEYIIPGKAAGRADDSKEIQWAFKQKKGGVREYGILIEVES